MKSTLSVLSLFTVIQVIAQTHPAIERFVSSDFMQGASLSLYVKETSSDSALYSYDCDREVIPASVMKTITTATAIEILGADYRYATSIKHDGVISDSILHGNLFISGSGDPSIGSSELRGMERDTMFRQWVAAIKRAGVKAVAGAVIADESVFDTEGVSMKWLREDLGSNYGQGCYGINVFDNVFSLYLTTKGNKPEIERTEPVMPSLIFHNYLKAGASDSCYIVGHPYSNERWLYGTVPSERTSYRLGGDIPDPPLYAACHLTEMLNREGVAVAGKPTCYRLLKEDNLWREASEESESTSKKSIITTYSEPLKELIRITNNVSSNLYADAFLKTAGLQCTEAVSSFERGSYILHKYWKDKGLDVTPLWMSDGSGLAPTDKVTSRFVCSVLSYMATKSPYSKEFAESLPRVGEEGTVRTFLKGSKLQGRARLKSGSMSRVRSYAGYIEKDGKQYAVAVIINNFRCTQSVMRIELEQLLSAMF